MATHVGYAFGRKRPSALVVLSGAERYPDTHLSGYLNRPTDLSPGPATSGVMNSLSTLALDRDYRDLYFAGGARISHKWGLGHGMALTLTGRSEAHRAARDEVSTDPETPRFRPVFPAERGTWHSLSTDLILPSPWESVSLAGGLLLGRFETRSFGEISGRVGYDKSSLGQGFDFEAELKGGVLVGEAPRQGHYLLGGRGTVPGYAFRSQIGDRFWLLRAEAAKNLLFPWVRLRAFGAAGGTGFTGDPFPPPWPEAPRSRILASAGGGLGLGWDVLRLDLARGLTGSGEWQVILSVNPEYWPWL